MLGTVSAFAYRHREILYHRQKCLLCLLLLTDDCIIVLKENLDYLLQGHLASVRACVRWQRYASIVVGCCLGLTHRSHNMWHK